MRHSTLFIAISLSFLVACSRQQPPRIVDSETPENRLATTQVADDAPAESDEAKVEEGQLGALSQLRSRREIAKSSAELATGRSDAQDSRLVESEALAAAPAYSPAAPPQPILSRQINGLELNTEKYTGHVDNPVQSTDENSVSTFSIDVDTGSYSNVRRMLAAGQRPPADAVRAEEMLNYFDYGYAGPASRAVPFRVSTEIAAAPWNPRHQLLQIGIQGYQVAKAEIPAANIVFLIDTSGSMQEPDKLPLVKQSMRELVKSLRAQDRVSMVVYAGSAGLVLPPTPGNEHETILAALDRLQAGGSTNGGAGLALAYQMARQAYIGNGVNRVVLATDGDFNVGTVDQKALETMIADQRKSGVALTTLGFGTGNYNDAMAEQLADLGNGNHAYIDSINEGRKVLVEEMSSTMMTIAQDAKIQVEFNPAVVAEYRLVGYENRALRREDFNNDKVDAGEIGAGHDVTALYEITLVGSGGESVDPLRYGKRSAGEGDPGSEIGWLRLRYKAPGGERSELIERALSQRQVSATPSPRLRWAAAVAAYADLLRGGRHVGNFGWPQIRSLAAGAVGEDRWGYRAEFLALVDRASAITAGDKPLAVSE